MSGMTMTIKRLYYLYVSNTSETSSEIKSPYILYSYLERLQVFIHWGKKKKSVLLLMLAQLMTK